MKTLYLAEIDLTNYNSFRPENQTITRLIYAENKEQAEQMIRSRFHTKEQYDQYGVCVNDVELHEPMGTPE